MNQTEQQPQQQTNVASKKKKSIIDLESINNGLFVSENCIINAVCDYGFTYDPDERKYCNKDKTIYIDVKTRLVYVLKECYNLTQLYEMIIDNILKVL